MLPIHPFSVLLWIAAWQCAAAGDTHSGGGGHILIVGSSNVDMTFRVKNLPSKGETAVSESPCAESIVAGGKGCNQAVAVARLVGDGLTSRFVGQFGNDDYAHLLRKTLEEHGVSHEGSSNLDHVPSGVGYVFLDPQGSVSSVVVSGSNAFWPPQKDLSIEDSLDGVVALLLQSEIPEYVNEAYAAAAAKRGIPVLQDIGGEDRPISDKLLTYCSFISPNLSELRRLTKMSIDSEAEIVEAAQSLIRRGAKCVLVTLGEKGAMLLTSEGDVIRQTAFTGLKTVDETAAGDCFRAAFTVALVEGLSWQECLRFASAAGALSVSRLGAVSSCPSRAEVNALCELEACKGDEADDFEVGNNKDVGDTPAVPPEFGSRLNSMKERLDLWEGGENDVLGWVQRQGQIQGLSLVDFNYPQHLKGLDPAQVKNSLSAAGLKSGAICLRFPKSMQMGAFTNPDEHMRTEAIKLTKEAAEWAIELGASEVIVWSAYDGYDYSHQVDYVEKWEQIVHAFQEVCDEFPRIKFSLEFKPTDENTRFFIVPSTGAALLLVNDVNRPNMGLTLDIGHCLAAGENPAQSVALVGSRGKLFGMQLNDGYQRLGAEDGLIFGSVHADMALEVMLWLQRTGYSGHLYFDTFPRNEDPVHEAEFNIRRSTTLWVRARTLEKLGIRNMARRHDALGIMDLIEKALSNT